MHAGLECWGLGVPVHAELFDATGVRSQAESLLTPADPASQLSLSQRKEKTEKESAGGEEDLEGTWPVVAQLSRRADTGMWCCGAGSSRVASSYPSLHKNPCAGDREVHHIDRAVPLTRAGPFDFSRSVLCFIVDYSVPMLILVWRVSPSLVIPSSNRSSSATVCSHGSTSGARGAVVPAGGRVLLGSMGETWRESPAPS
jgi:hypothetical protein